MKTDEAWMTEYREGSEEAFMHLYGKYSAMVYGFIKKRMRDSEVEDLYQKVWRQLHEKKHLYQGQPFAPWFFVIIKHLVIDEYRSLGRKNLKPIQHEIIEKMYSEKVQEEEIEEFLRHLPQETQDLVRKYYLEEVSYEELEIETGLSQTNLRQRLSRAVRGLRKKIYEE
jgi:RNA polymerase sigma-70 factor (ECF subfamily)